MTLLEVLIALLYRCKREDKKALNINKNAKKNWSDKLDTMLKRTFCLTLELFLRG